MEEVPITKIEVRSIEAKGELKTPREALFNDIDWCKWKLQNKNNFERSKKFKWKRYIEPKRQKEEQQRDKGTQKKRGGKEKETKGKSNKKDKQ